MDVLQGAHRTAASLLRCAAVLVLCVCWSLLLRHLDPPAPPPPRSHLSTEMARRKLLEESPIPSTNEEPVLFDTSEIPWWAWVRRFHLPEVSRDEEEGGGREEWCFKRVLGGGRGVASWWDVLWCGCVGKREVD